MAYSGARVRSGGINSSFSIMTVALHRIYYRARIYFLRRGLFAGASYKQMNQHNDKYKR
jgi:hypothetical protein